MGNIISMQGVVYKIVSKVVKVSNYNHDEWESVLCLEVCTQEEIKNLELAQ